MAREFSGTATVALATTDEFFGGPITEDSMAIELSNSGGNAFDAFEIWAKAHSLGAYVKIASVTADFTTPKGVIKTASGDPTVLAAGTKALILLVQLTSLYAISLRASSAVGSTTLDWKVRI